MSGPRNEYTQGDCVKGLKDLSTGKMLQVSYNSAGKCNNTKCTTVCKLKKK